MKTQKEYMNFIKKEFKKHIEINSWVLDKYCYNDHRAIDVIRCFVDSVKSAGLQFSNCYHANGIGNNNDYTIFIETKDSDGFIVQKNIANFYYCCGIYGGCYVSLKDLSTNEKIEIGEAR